MKKKINDFRDYISYAYAYLHQRFNTERKRTRQQISQKINKRIRILHFATYAYKSNTKKKSIPDV